jgi:hypothetical protein
MRAERSPLLVDRRTDAPELTEIHPDEAGGSARYFRAECRP